MQLQRGAADQAEALARLDEAFARMPDEMQLLFVSCVALDLLHLRDELRERSDRLLVRDRDNVGAWGGRGNALLGSRRHEEAAHGDAARSPAPLSRSACAVTHGAVRGSGAIS